MTTFHTMAERLPTTE